MRKMYFMILLVLIAAGNVMAQDPVTEVSVMFNNWDGEPLGDNQVLKMIVGQKEMVSLTIEPENADLGDVFLSVESEDEDPLGIVYCKDLDTEVIAQRPGTGWLYLYRKNIDNPEEVDMLAEARIIVSADTADYIAYGLLCLREDGGPCEEEYVEPGQVWWSIDKSYRLAFWAEALGCNRIENSDYSYYSIPDYRDSTATPWYAYKDKITEIVLDNMNYVGAYAFCNMPLIRYVTLPENMEYLGNYLFLGCTNLKAIEVSRYSAEGANSPITYTNGNALVIEEYEALESPAPEQVRVGLIIVNNEDEGALRMYSNPDMGYEWSYCNVISKHGKIEGVEAQWSLASSEASGAPQLVVSQNAEAVEPMAIPDRTEDMSFAWDDLGDVVEEIVIEGDVSYIGAGAFESLWGVEAIQFRDNQVSDESNPMRRRARKGDDNRMSLHVRAFPMETMPWKFAFGDPDDGPVLPPTVEFGDMDEQEAREMWKWHFSETTVLYVPDVTFEFEGKQVRSIDLYREDPMWGECFNRITDRTVETEDVTTESVKLKWLPLEGASAYKLTIAKMEEGCEDCFQTITIPATGPRGLVDFNMLYENGKQVPAHIAARPNRAPQGDDGSGGMTLTIEINGGQAHNQDVMVSVSGMSSGISYAYSRDVLKEDETPDPKLSKVGAFETEDDGDGIEDVWFVGGKGIFDLLGRPVGDSLEKLPDGIYIMVNDGVRTTVLLRK